MTCAFIHGDLPIEISWSHNGRILSALDDNDNSLTLVNSKRSSALNIDSISGEHAGNYTCTGVNRAGTESLSTQLFVNG